MTAGATAERSLISNIDFSPTHLEMLVRIGPASMTPSWSARSLLHIDWIFILSTCKQNSILFRACGPMYQSLSEISRKHMTALKYMENRWIIRAGGVVLTLCT